MLLNASQELSPLHFARLVATSAIGVCQDTERVQGNLRAYSAHPARTGCSLRA